MAANGYCTAYPDSEPGKVASHDLHQRGDAHLQILYLEGFANIISGIRPQRGASQGVKAAPLLIYPAAGREFYSTENSEEPNVTG